MLLFAVAVPSIASARDDSQHLVRVPTVSERCIAQGRFSCYEYEHILTVEGVSCTEDCLYLNKLNSCQLRNRCIWDVPSGCFLKQVCADISVRNSCLKWEEQAICR